MKLADLAMLGNASDSAEARLAPFSLVGDVISYKRCPRQYALQTKYEFETDRPTQRFVGQLVHEVLGKAYSAYKGRVPGHPARQLPDAQTDLPGYIRDKVRSLKGRNVFAASPEVEDSVKRNLIGFYELEMRRLIPKIEESIVSLGMDRDGYRLTGRVVVVKDDVADANRLEVVKYKGSRAPDPKAPDGMLREREAVMELLCYAALYENGRGRLPSRARMYFVGEYQAGMGVAPPNGVMVLDVNRAEVSMALLEVDRTIAPFATANRRRHGTRPPLGDARQAPRPAKSVNTVPRALPKALASPGFPRLLRPVLGTCPGETTACFQRCLYLVEESA